MSDSTKKTSKGDKWTNSLGEKVITKAIPTKTDNNTPIANYTPAKKAAKNQPPTLYRPNTPLRPSKSFEGLNSPGIPARRRAKSAVPKPTEEKAKAKSGGGPSKNK
ncbi:hypothetical protein CONLIGDRAFT_223631 [Coniochaeta ligniaria NRRL 30616]|uniref:Uncharacterized protein n=1 Tax=Coniochaeta ligniaria NRRL 30616 TaxID=1408157 RepID=A0A1J7I4I9_9PEZI|nr:hypothetical protein CONLIGDRAFT_223631 [Coniochaeta ligniaria NRRL 30616]